MGEGVVFSRIVWLAKATRDAAMPKLTAAPRLVAGADPMPFDGRRMILARVAPVHAIGV